MGVLVLRTSRSLGSGKKGNQGPKGIPVGDRDACVESTPISLFRWGLSGTVTKETSSVLLLPPSPT